MSAAATEPTLKKAESKTPTSAVSASPKSAPSKATDVSTAVNIETAVAGGDPVTALPAAGRERDSDEELIARNDPDRVGSQQVFVKTPLGKIMTLNAVLERDTTATLMRIIRYTEGRSRRPASLWSIRMSRAESRSIWGLASSCGCLQAFQRINSDWCGLASTLTLAQCGIQREATLLFYLRCNGS
jgi:hypothetical protein